MSKDLLLGHLAYIEKAKARGCKTAFYKTPCCGEPLEDRLAPKGKLWDTISVCPYCGAHYMKLVSHHAIIGNTLTAGPQHDYD